MKQDTIEVLHRLEEAGLEVKCVLSAGDYCDATVHNDSGSSVVLCVYPEGLAIGPSDMRSPAYFRWPEASYRPMACDVSGKDNHKYFHKSNLKIVLNHMRRMLS